MRDTQTRKDENEPGVGRKLTGSRALFAKLLSDVRASYWFLPTLCVVMACVLAALTLWLDHMHPALASALPSALSEKQIDGARGMLTLMASSVIGVTGVMFSMTMVAVSFASGNFGPRLIGNFMRDRGTQWSLGILIGTFAFCLQVLRAVHGADDGIGFIPYLSLNVALGLTMVSVMVMIYFVHHVPETINVSNITASLGHRLEACIRTEIRRSAGPQEQKAQETQPEGAPLAQPSLGKSGYVQSLDTRRLRTLADRHGWAILLRAQPGDFVTAAMPVVEVHAGPSDTPPGDKDEASLCACFALGEERTEDQNPAFLVDQLVEMTARALSSGVNDPFTALDCLNRMFAALDVSLVWNGGLSQVECGALGRNRLTFVALLKRSFAASVPYVRGDPIAAAHLDDLIGRLRPSARTDGERTALDDLSEALQSNPAKS